MYDHDCVVCIVSDIVYCIFIYIYRILYVSVDKVVCSGCQGASCFQSNLDVQIHRWGWLHSPTQIKESRSLDVGFSIGPLDQLQLCHTQKNDVKDGCSCPHAIFFVGKFPYFIPLTYNPTLPVLQHDFLSRWQQPRRNVAVWVNPLQGCRHYHCLTACRKSKMSSENYPHEL